MSEREQIPERLHDLIEEYLDGLLDEAGMHELEGLLRADASARLHFVRYARLHTDLYLEARARQAGGRALERIEKLAQLRKASAIEAASVCDQRAKRATLPQKALRRFLTLKRLGIAAGILIAAVAGLWAARGWFAPAQPEDEPAIAWLVNAQDCTWRGSGPTGNLQAGRELKIDRGLAEIHFQCGARVLLEGPSVLELISGKSARLASGKLTARVPPKAVGFEICLISSGA